MRGTRLALRAGPFVAGAANHGTGPSRPRSRLLSNAFPFSCPLCLFVAHLDPRRFRRCKLFGNVSCLSNANSFSSYRGRRFLNMFAPQMVRKNPEFTRKTFGTDRLSGQTGFRDRQDRGLISPSSPAESSETYIRRRVFVRHVRLREAPGRFAENHTLLIGGLQPVNL